MGLTGTEGTIGCDCAGADWIKRDPTSNEPLNDANEKNPALVNVEKIVMIRAKCVKS